MSKQVKDLCKCGHDRNKHLPFGGGCTKCGVDPESLDLSTGRTKEFQNRPGSCERFTWDPQA